MRKKHILLSGERFGNWVIIKQAESRNYNTYYLCECVCGNIAEVQAGRLVNGNSKGCSKCQLSRLHHKDIEIHNMSKTRVYEIWSAMLKRTLKTYNHNYKDYGARGITVCEEWKTFTNFYNWAINNGYQENLTIDRIDNNGNYEPSNCRWATKVQQANNKRDTIRLSNSGKTKTLSEWAIYYNMNYQKAWQRYNRGLDFNAIFSKNYGGKL